MTVERIDPPTEGDERSTLEGFLDYQRQTLAWKCDGVEPRRLAERGVPPSTMSLHGLVRHMADVERAWFQRVLAGDDSPPIFYDRDTNVDGDFDDVDEADADADLAVWRRECERSRQIAATMALDETGVDRRSDTTFSLRWVLVHMIEEYARHNGHADLLRERIDGVTGE